MPVAGRLCDLTMARYRCIAHTAKTSVSDLSSENISCISMKGMSIPQCTQKGALYNYVARANRPCDRRRAAQNHTCKYVVAAQFLSVL